MTIIDFYESCDIGSFQEGCLFDGRYLVREELGEGGFAKTWRCFDIQLDIDVVVKIFKPDVKPEMIRNEFKASYAITHPRCARFLDMNIDQFFYQV